MRGFSGNYVVMDSSAKRKHLAFGNWRLLILCCGVVLFFLAQSKRKVLLSGKPPDVEHATFIALQTKRMTRDILWRRRRPPATSFRKWLDYCKD
jgi:hypothetical protein